MQKMHKYSLIEVTNMHECFHCGEQSVIWDCDYDFEDFGYEGEGIVHVLHCCSCGAVINYLIPFGEKTSDYSHHESMLTDNELNSIEMALNG